MPRDSRSCCPSVSISFLSFSISISFYLLEEEEEEEEQYLARSYKLHSPGFEAWKQEFLYSDPSGGFIFPK